MVGHAYSPSTKGAKVGGLLLVGGHPGQHRVHMNPNIQTSVPPWAVLTAKVLRLTWTFQTTKALLLFCAVSTGVVLAPLRESHWAGKMGSPKKLRLQLLGWLLLRLPLGVQEENPL